MVDPKPVVEGATALAFLGTGIGKRLLGPGKRGTGGKFTPFENHHSLCTKRAFLNNMRKTFHPSLSF
jgi:hypothetical protein